MTADLCGLPPLGWQAQILPRLAEIATGDVRIHELRTFGSASGPAVSTDLWSDLDLLLVAQDPAIVAEDFARNVEASVAPVFTSNRCGTTEKYVIRLVMSDLRFPGGAASYSATMRSLYSAGKVRRFGRAAGSSPEARVRCNARAQSPT